MAYSSSLRGSPRTTSFFRWSLIVYCGLWAFVAFHSIAAARSSESEYALAAGLFGLVLSAPLSMATLGLVSLFGSLDATTSGFDAVSFLVQQAVMAVTGFFQWFVAVPWVVETIAQVGARRPDFDAKEDVGMSSPHFAPIQGEPYFIVMYEDEALSIPVVQTLLFEKSLSGEHGVDHLFREIGANGDTRAFKVANDQVEELLLDLEGLIEKLRSGLAK